MGADACAADAEDDERNGMSMGVMVPGLTLLPEVVDDLLLCCGFRGALDMVQAAVPESLLLG